MSRPPRPTFRVTTTGGPAARDGRLTVAPNKFGELVRVQQELAAEEALVSISGAEGDFAQSMVELSALLGHALSVYQDLFASEAYLSTAQMPRSLVRHARRLAYAPDIGVSATGYVVLEVGAGLRGALLGGFSLASVPRGAQKAQDYETLDDVDVDAAWNDLRPIDSVMPATVSFDASGAATLRVTGVGFDLQVGEHVLLIGTARWLALTVSAVSEDAAAGETLVSVAGGPASQSFAAAGHILHAKPELPLHLFGWNAPGNAFAAGELQSQGQYTALDPSSGSVSVGDTSSGYTVTGPAAGYDALDVFLSQEVQAPIADTFLLLGSGAATLEVCKVLSLVAANVTFTVGKIIGITVTTFDGFGTPTTTTQKELVENGLSATVSALRLQRFALTNVDRTTLAIQPLSYAGWSVRAPLAVTEPNPAAVGGFLDLPADLTGMRPGRPLAFASIDETTAQVVELRKFELVPGGATRIWWAPLTPLPGGFAWTLSGVKVLGNVARISHGKAIDEALGGSDGITPFQTFELKKTPLTLLPGADGTEPELEVRVSDVAWKRVEDFYLSGPRDRVFRLSFNEKQETSIIFGDGRRGALPPSGKKNITARYRAGLGTAGNAESGQVARIKKTNPLIDAASNLTEMNGGTDPANLEDVRSLAVRYIRTFDRAVSVQDHADLALLFPGAARAAARWDDLNGIQLVVATAEGDALDSKEDLRAFLDLRRDTEIRLALLDPQPVDVYVTLSIEHDPGYLAENIKNAVQDALFGSAETAPGMFTFAAREFGQPAFLSEVYAVTEDVEGVTFVRVTRLSLSAGPQVFDTLKATASQWLRLQAQNAEISLTAGAAV